MATVYLSIGSNLGNRRTLLIRATTLLAERAGDILALSGFYETEPWGYDSTHAFLNMAVHLETSLLPLELLTITQQIERDLGRTPKKEKNTYEDRPIDIDILLYDDLILDNPQLTIPHPFMHQRMFVLQPLAEIAPHIIHPVRMHSITKLLDTLNKNTI